MKYFIAIFSILFLISCDKQPAKIDQSVPFIPSDASLVIKCNSLKQLNSHFTNNSLTQKNDKNTFLNYFKNLTPFQLLSSKKQAFYLCYSPVGKSDLGFTLVTSLKNAPLSNSTIKKYTSATFTYNKFKYNEIDYENNTLYSATIDSTWIATDNKLLLENSIRQIQNKQLTNPTFTEGLKSLDVDKSFSIIIDNTNFSDVFERLLPNYDIKKINKKRLSGWTAGDITVDSDALIFDGIYKAKDSIYDYLNLFNKTQSTTNQLAKVTPSTAKSYTSYTYNDYSQLSKNIALYNHQELDLEITDTLNDFLAETEEFGVIQLKNDKAIAFSLLDEALDVTTYLETNNYKETFRDFSIYKLKTTLNFDKKLAPILNEVEVNYYIQIENLIVFAKTTSPLKEIISAIKNEDVFINKAWYTQFAESIASQSSILHVQSSSDFLDEISQNVAKNYTENWKKTTLGSYKLAAMQCNADNGFTHIRQVISKTTSKKSDFKVSQTSSIVLENDLINDPQFVKNHLTKGMDVVVQDKKFELSLLSNTGKILWQKEIGEPILGKVQQMDMYRNGRLQLVFTTPSKLHVLDRNGKNVSPFPIKYTSITQPVAVFDYEKKRKYRIAVVQNGKITLRDNVGKKVNGFNFKNKANGTITHTPKHIRVGSKDYIIVNETAKGVHFLNRTGKERIKVKGAIETTNEWFWYKNAFSTLSADNLLTQVNTKGVVSRVNPNLKPAESAIDATAKTLVTITENVLTIKDKKVDLDFGVYSSPKIFYINNKIYVGVTDTQASKIYLYDSNAKLIKGFPVYGNSLIDLANSDKDNVLELVAKGEANSVLFYEMN